jgi:hypothetical protein
MKTILLKTGEVACVDSRDFKKLAQHQWRLHPNGAAYAIINRKTVLMHRFILNTRRGLLIKHGDENKLNNRRSNLLKITHSQRATFQNAQKAKGNRPSSSQFKGVYWNSRCGSWNAAVRTDGKRIYLGAYQSEIEAAKAYNAAAPLIFGKSNTWLNPV